MVETWQNPIFIIQWLLSFSGVSDLLVKSYVKSYTVDDIYIGFQAVSNFDVINCRCLYAGDYLLQKSRLIIGSQPFTMP